MSRLASVSAFDWAIWGRGGQLIRSVFDLTAVSVDCRNKKEGAVHYLPLFGRERELIASGWIQEIRFSAEVFQQREIEMR